MVYKSANNDGNHILKSYHEIETSLQFFHVCVTLCWLRGSANNKKVQVHTGGGRGIGSQPAPGNEIPDLTRASKGE